MTWSRRASMWTTWVSMATEEKWPWPDGNTAPGNSSLSVNFAFVISVILNWLMIHLLNVTSRSLHTFRLEDLCEKAEQRSQQLQSAYELHDEWKQCGDKLLYSMIPQSVADTLRHGADTLKTCQVSIESTLRTESIIKYWNIWRRAGLWKRDGSLCRNRQRRYNDGQQRHGRRDLHELCLLLLRQHHRQAPRLQSKSFECNSSRFQIKWFELQMGTQVETVGQVYMVVGGAPDKSQHHVQDVALVALSFRDEINNLRTAKPIQIRIGCCSLIKT